MRRSRPARPTEMASDSTDTTEEEKRESVVRWRICAAVTILVVLLTAASVAMRPSFHAGDLVAIKNLHTGKYLAVGTDGLVRASAETNAEPAARFRLLGLDSKFLQAMGALHAKAPQKNLGVGGKLGCPCSGESDEHGFGRFCHNWESEFHRPWCYVSATCSHGVRSKRHTSKLLQVCGMEEGYLGPEGWEAAPGCACTGHESVHGFGAFCKGWEFAGQTPWCAARAAASAFTPTCPQHCWPHERRPAGRRPTFPHAHESLRCPECSTLRYPLLRGRRCYVQEECDGAMGTDGARFTDCVPTDAFSPPPPPPPPIGPLVESKGGWGTPAGCLCSGWSNKHGFGAHCEVSRVAHLSHHPMDCSSRARTLSVIANAPPQPPADPDSAPPRQCRAGRWKARSRGATCTTTALCPPQAAASSAGTACHVWLGATKKPSLFFLSCPGHQETFPFLLFLPRHAAFPTPRRAFWLAEDGSDPATVPVLAGNARVFAMGCMPL